MVFGPLFLTQFLRYSSVFWANEMSHGAPLDGSCSPQRVVNHETPSPFLPPPFSREVRGAGNGLNDWSCCQNPLSTGFRVCPGWRTRPCSGKVTGETVLQTLPCLSLLISSDCPSPFNKLIDASVSAPVSCSSNDHIQGEEGGQPQMYNSQTGIVGNVRIHYFQLARLNWSQSYGTKSLACRIWHLLSSRG